MGVGRKMRNDKLLYTACGLDNVYLLNGYHFVETRRGRMIRIDDQQGLHRVIAHHLVRQRRSLTGKELRFLRHYLGLSQAALAELLGESEQSVARREKRRKNWTKPTLQDRVLRYMIEQRSSGREKLQEFLQSLVDAPQSGLNKVEFRKSRRTSKWERAGQAIAA